MDKKKLSEIFTKQTMDTIFPATRADEFFEALFGDASEGAYDISVELDSVSDTKLTFHLNLTQRPGCCLVCNLTYGLPEVFSRHPIINIAGLVKEIDNLLGDTATCGDWQLERTISVSNALHKIPLSIALS